jgi:pyruvate kinase
VRKTKIVVTLGPATDSTEMIGRLIDAGMNVVRLNMSHARHEWVRRVVREIRAAAAARKVAVGIMLDTQGPAIRTGDLPAPLALKAGDRLVLTVRGAAAPGVNPVSVNYDGFVNDVQVGSTVLLDNGEIHLRVLGKSGNQVDCEALTPGTLGNRRHINLPGVRVSLPALTDQDLADVALGLELGVDYLALSFVREAADIRQLRQVIARSSRPPGIIAKVENQFAVRNLDDILAEADAVMVARGDLGIECPYQELALIQREIVKACLRIGRPVIVATQLLESMIENPLPTRAEITDVANAVFEECDAIMLSGETTLGKYPLACLEVLDRIARRMEQTGGANYHQAAVLDNERQKLVKSAVVLADDLKADAILVFTKRGNMPRFASWMRPFHSPIYAFCESGQMANSLSLLWGVFPVVMPMDLANPEHTIARALQALRISGELKKGQTAVVITLAAAGDQLVDAVQMRFVERDDFAE